jgi:hypothetical protein
MKRTCPHCNVRLDYDREMAHCPQCRSSFMLMPSLRELAAIVRKLDTRERNLIAHFANNPLAAVIANLSYLADADDLPADLQEVVADTREAVNLLALVVATLTGIDTNVQSR